MATTFTDMLELQKSHLDAVNAAGRAMFGAAEKWADLNVAAAKAALQDGSETAQALLAVREPQDFVGLAAGAGKPAMEKLAGYSRNAYGIANGARSELTKIFQAQRSENNRRIGDWIDFAAQSAPAGTEPAFTVWRLAFANANAAFDTFFQAAQTAGDWAESNWAAATSSTIDAVTAANEATKGKARKAANA